MIQPVQITLLLEILLLMGEAMLFFLNGHIILLLQIIILIKQGQQMMEF